MDSTPKPGETREIVWSLWSEQLKQVAWLATAGAGAALVLLERGLLEAGRPFAIALTVFSLSAVVAVFGQIKLVERLEAGGSIDRSLKSYLYVALLLFSGGAGALIGAFL